MQSTEGYVLYGGSKYDLTLDIPGRQGIDAPLLRAIQRDVIRKLGGHGDSTKIRIVTITVEGDAVGATFKAEVA